MSDFPEAIIVISEEETNTRLDKILADRFKEIKSRNYFQYLIEEQKVLLNGNPIRKRQKPKAGDEIQIEFMLPPEVDLAAEAIPLEIIYEDPDILIINKPAGMVVHPAPGNWSGTLVNALLHHCQNLLESFPAVTEGSSHLRPGIVHRLDKDTSGLLIAAKHTLAHQRLVGMFSEKQIHKEYLAICVGNPGNIEINQPIGRHPVHRQQMAVVETGGKYALSICKTLAANGQLSAVNIVLATGRTHQIRVHLKHHGAPVLGDPLYGNLHANQKYQVQRQLLLAHRISFKHPITGCPLKFQAPIPNDISIFLEKLKLDVVQF